MRQRGTIMSSLTSSRHIELLLPAWMPQSNRQCCIRKLVHIFLHDDDSMVAAEDPTAFDLCHLALRFTAYARVGNRTENYGYDSLMDRNLEKGL